MEKYITLTRGTEEDIQWEIWASIQNNGAFHHKGAFGFHKPDKMYHRIRTADRKAMKKMLGEKYMKGKEIHHDKNLFCFVLSTTEHKIKHGGRGLL